ncbi:MAG TPA: YfhO family protein, partial [Verrucomicrobiae bacterium]|nr:YfhO family protein [Verrucomicrobiae bacterium]
NLAHLFWAGLGMYFLAHRWTANRLAASVAGLIFAFNGLSWHMLIWISNLAAYAWMPWVVLCLERAWREGGGRNLVMAALAGAMQMLTGAPEVILLTWFVLGTLWLAQWLGGEVARAPMAWRFAGVSILVFGLSAAQLLPFLDLLSHSQRSASFGDSQWSMPPGGWANYLVPLFHCAPGAQNVYSQDDQYWTASYYLGVGTVALALVALWRVRNRRMWILAGLAVFGLTMALGDAGRVYPVVKKLLPVIGFMRFPIKFVVLVTFVVPLLAAQALGWWQQLSPAQWPVERKRLFWVGGLLLGAMGFIVWWEWNHHPPAQDNPLLITKNALLRALFLALILGCLALTRRLEGTRPQRLAALGLLLLIWSDVLTHAPNLSPTVGREVYETDKIRQYHRENQDSKWDEQLKLGNGRAMLTVGALSKMTFQATAGAVSDIYGRRLALWSNYNLLDHAAKFDGFFSLNVRQISQLITQVYMATNNGLEDMPRLKDFLGISQINQPTNALDWISRNTALPMVTIGQEPRFLEDAAVLQQVTGSAFDPVRFVYLPAEARQFVTVTNRTEAKILSQHIEPQRVTARVSADAPAMLVVAQSFYHPWHAYVDGTRTRLFRANYAFQALEVPAGQHEVKLVFEDNFFHFGVIISMGSLAGCLILWRRGRKVRPG